MNQYSAGGYAAFGLCHHVVKSLGANVSMQIVTVREGKWRFVKDWACNQ